MTVGASSAAATDPGGSAGDSVRINVKAKRDGEFRRFSVETYGQLQQGIQRVFTAANGARLFAKLESKGTIAPLTSDADLIAASKAAEADGSSAVLIHVRDGGAAQDMALSTATSSNLGESAGSTAPRSHTTTIATTVGVRADAKREERSRMDYMLDRLGDELEGTDGIGPQRPPPPVVTVAKRRPPPRPRCLVAEEVDAPTAPAAELAPSPPHRRLSMGQRRTVQNHDDSSDDGDGGTWQIVTKGGRQTVRQEEAATTAAPAPPLPHEQLPHGNYESELSTGPQSSARMTLNLRTSPAVSPRPSLPASLRSPHRQEGEGGDEMGDDGNSIDEDFEIGDAYPQHCYHDDDQSNEGDVPVWSHLPTSQNAHHSCMDCDEHQYADDADALAHDTTPDDTASSSTASTLRMSIRRRGAGTSAVVPSPHQNPTPTLPPPPPRALQVEGAANASSSDKELREHLLSMSHEDLADFALTLLRDCSAVAKERDAEFRRSAASAPPQNTEKCFVQRPRRAQRAASQPPPNASRHPPSGEESDVTVSAWEGKPASDPGDLYSPYDLDCAAALHCCY